MDTGRTKIEQKTTYTDLTGKKIQNPIDSITKINQQLYFMAKNRKKPNDNNHQISYLGHCQSTNTGFCELWGKRRTQEDRLLTRLIPRVKEVDPKDIPDLMQKTLNSLNEQIFEKKLTGGSTVIASLILKDQLITSNLGDSEAFLLSMNEKDEIIEFNLINTESHNLSNEKERNRVGKENVMHDGHIYRLKSPQESAGLALSRSLGDKDYIKRNLSDEADHYTTEFKLSDKTRHFLVIFCDGVRENNCLTLDCIKEILQSKLKKESNIPLNQTTMHLGLEAIKKGSTDNISISITELTSAIKGQLIALFDGHLDDSVSQFLYEHFGSELEYHLQNYLTKKITLVDLESQCKEYALVIQQFDHTKSESKDNNETSAQKIALSYLESYKKAAYATLEELDDIEEIDESLQDFQVSFNTILDMITIISTDEKFNLSHTISSILPPISKDQDTLYSFDGMISNTLFLLSSDKTGRSETALKKCQTLLKNDNPSFSKEWKKFLAILQKKQKSVNDFTTLDIMVDFCSSEIQIEETIKAKEYLSDLLTELQSKLITWLAEPNNKAFTHKSNQITFVNLCTLIQESSLLTMKDDGSILSGRKSTKHKEKIELYFNSTDAFDMIGTIKQQLKQLKDLSSQSDKTTHDTTECKKTI